MIGNFTVVSDSVLSFETGCYYNITLICTASKPMLVLSPLIVRWMHNGSVQHQSAADDGTFVTSTLNFLASTANDSATYMYVCHATLDIPDSDIIMINRSSSVIKFSRGKTYAFCYHA